MSGLPMWVVYDHPLDFPHTFVARRFSGVTPTGETIEDEDLIELRHKIRRKMPMGLRFTRADDDDPCIAEVWL